jgi:competence protein ComEA
MQKQLRNALAFLLVVLALAPLAAQAAPAGVVNVNTASVQQLELLPRIGPSVAQRIVERRKAGGNRFASLEDLMLVQGIGEKTFAQLKPYLTLAGETTLKEKVKSPSTGKRATTAKPAAAKPAPAASGQKG